MEELEPFKNSMIDLIKNIKFETKQNKFQKQLKAEKEDIEKEKKLIIAADKTSNHYRVEPEKYHDLLERNVNKEYKKADLENVKKVNQAHKVIINSLGIQN